MLTKHFFAHFLPKCNNNTLMGAILLQKIFLGWTPPHPTIPVSASPIPHTGLEATNNSM